MAAARGGALSWHTCVHSVLLLVKNESSSRSTFGPDLTLYYKSRKVSSTL